ncbi:phospholipase D-like domain-containing protein [Fulvivirga sediminis]|uniref:Phospholipase D-like domain-containing protein n=1 Tax=Fulvivirga sediminis TaxID=2803949 RepID=A0A937FAX5_9BACT|nr:phospholipase D-like domain-containing protein [Fulvivirga sediminis]MBL3658576.1 hypothetical protein [Fulvivirga sediminis]
MIEIVDDIEKELSSALVNAVEIWTAVAMMNNGGFKHFKNLPTEVVQHHLVGIDLPTPPKILEKLRSLCSNNFNAKVREAEYCFHPKTYIIKHKDGSLIAFVGSSNATTGGLINNVELNIKITTEKTCKELIGWYWNMDSQAVLITQELINEHRKRFKRIKELQKAIDNEVDEIKVTVTRNNGQFFTLDHHTIFSPEYRTRNSVELKKLRSNTRRRLIDLHNRIYHQFANYGLEELYQNSRKQDRTSRASINRFSGMTIQSIWLHYGKSKDQLGGYDKENASFVNHIRLQVIIHEKNVGVWLVLGQPNGSSIDRSAFRRRMQNKNLKQRLFDSLMEIKNDYWISAAKNINLRDISQLEDIDEILTAEKDYEYFIIGRDYYYLDEQISDVNIESTVLNEFVKLYPIYELMNAEIDLF